MLFIKKTLLFIKKTRLPVIKKIKTKPLKDKVPSLKIRIFKKRIFFVNRFIMSLTLLVMVMGVLGFGAVVYKIHTLEPNARKIKLNLIKETLSSQTTITDTNDEILMQTELFNYYIPVDLKNKSTVSDLYLKTIISVEDKDFYTRKTKGYDLRSLSAAGISMIKSKLHQTAARGGSTLDQQLIKNLIYADGTAPPTTSRKIIELMNSHSLAKRYSRDEILQGYLNTIRLTPDTIGVSAAWTYLFGDSLNNTIDMNIPLNVAKTAYIAGLGQSPSDYRINFKTSGIARTKLVLGIMYDSNLISKKMYKDALLSADTELQLKVHDSTGVVEDFQPYLAKVTSEVNDLNLPTQSTIKIKTWATKEQLVNLSKIAKFTYVDANSQGLSQLPNGTETAISAIDTKTGHILGIATNSSNPNTPLLSNRSSGSSIKPLIDFAPALEGGLITPMSLLNGNTTTYSDGTPLYNYGLFNYGNVTATKALNLSLNTSAFQAFKMVSGDYANNASPLRQSIMRPLGLAKSEYLDSDSIGLNISTFDEASAFQAIGNDGVRIEPTTIQTITVNNKDIELKKQSVVRAMSSSTARDLVQMLQGVTQVGGSEPLAAQPQWQGAFAAKSGLVGFDDNVTDALTNTLGYNPMPSSDAWLVGTTSGVTVSTWLGVVDFSGNYYIQSGTNGQPVNENTSRVYLLNNSLRMLNPQSLQPFTYTGEKLTSNVNNSTIPTVTSYIPDTSIFNKIIKFNPEPPVLDVDLVNFKKSNENANLLDVSKLYTGQDLPDTLIRK